MTAPSGPTELKVCMSFEDICSVPLIYLTSNSVTYACARTNVYVLVCSMLRVALTMYAYASWCFEVGTPEDLHVKHVA